MLERVLFLTSAMFLILFNPIYVFIKWHLPEAWLYLHDNPLQRVYDYNMYNFRTGSPSFLYMDYEGGHYEDTVEFLTQRDNIDIKYKDGDQSNWYSGFPFTPFAIDPMFGLPTNSPPCCPYDQMGRDALPAMYTRAAITGFEALQALNRLINNKARTKHVISPLSTTTPTL